MAERPPAHDAEQAAPLLVEPGDGWVRLVLNEPRRLNAVSEEMYSALLSELDAAERDDSVRALILAGAGRAFCAGANLKRHAAGDRDADQRREYATLAGRVCERLQQIRKPVVAAVHGYAFGAGLELALSADFLLAADDAVMAFPEISLATYVGGGVTSSLPRLVGLARARRLLFLGERFTGADAAGWGLAAASVPAGTLAQEAETLASRLAALAPRPVEMMKADLIDAGRRSLADALEAEIEHLLACMATDDWAEGVAAFKAGRAPVYRGR